MARARVTALAFVAGLVASAAPRSWSFLVSGCGVDGWGVAGGLLTSPSVQLGDAAGRAWWGWSPAADRAVAQAAGLRVTEVAASRPICANCAQVIRGAGAKVGSAVKEVTP